MKNINELIEKIENTQFYKDLQNEKKTPTNRGWYNLIVSIRDLGLWKIGMKPHRNWRVTDVKKYFGLKGRDKEKLYKTLIEYRDIIKG